MNAHLTPPPRSLPNKYDQATAVDVMVAPCPCDDCLHRRFCRSGDHCAAFALFVRGVSEPRWRAAPRSAQ
jgi:hypothetical protein